MRRRKRLVRLHYKDHNTSLEGVFVGFWCNHYVLRVPRVLEGADASYSLEGEVIVPKDRVLFVQRLEAAS